MNGRVTIDAIRAALTFIPADDRDLWVRIGMALKSELAEEGLSLFESWSERGASFDSKAVKSTWKSIKPGGAVTIATLLGEAKDHGFDIKQFALAAPLSADDQARLERERSERAAAAAEAEAAKHESAAREAKRLWEGAAPSGASPYLERKNVASHGLRYQKKMLLVPLVDETGRLWNVQRILDNGDKRGLAGGRVSGCFHLIGSIPSTGWLMLAEGYATAATLHQATGHPVAMCVNRSNIRHVASILRKLHPGLKLLICADDDRDTEAKTGSNPGVAAAAATAKALASYWCKPEHLPAGATDFNDLAAHAGIDIVRTQIAAVTHAADVDGSPTPATKATRAPRESTSKSKGANDVDAQSTRPFFRVDDRGVWYHGFSNQGEPLPPQWICSPLNVTAKSRDAHNGAWGYLLEFHDADGNPKRWAMPASMLAGDGTEYRKTLLDMGLQIGAGANAKTQLTMYINTRQIDMRVRCTDRIGWHEDVYVLPDRTIGEGDELVMFQSAGGVVSQFKQQGTLDDWRREVASLCRGNSRLAFCVSAAFAAPLLHHTGIASGGFHIWGDSSTGKSTAFKVAGSVYGGKDYPRNWRMTDNALETVAVQHSDALLLLDEIAQVDPKVVGDTVYMLANETGKGRATQTATARRTHSWRVLFLSDGEVSLANHMSEAGKGTRGGHDVRMAHIAADAGKGFGVYETLHGFTDGAALSNHMVTMAHQFYGVAGMAFIEWAVRNAGDLRNMVREQVSEIATGMSPDGAHGQVSRVASRFSLVGVAGELATMAGITGWERGEAMSSARTCFAAWLEGRGGSGNTEHSSILRQVSGFFQAHGDSRFTWWHRAMDDRKPNTINRAGFKRMLTKEGTPINSNSDHHREYGDVIHPEEADSMELEYFVLPEVYRTEICKGYSVKAVTHLLLERGLLIPSGTAEKQRADRNVRLPGVGKVWCYQFSSRVMSADV